jgi:hypothetical protein
MLRLRKKESNVENKQGTYTVRDWEGQTHNIQGDPQSLTLRDALSEVSGKKGGSVAPSGVLFKAGSREYRESDLNKSFRDLGIQPGSTIEVVQQ